MLTAWTYWTKEIAAQLSTQLGVTISPDEIVSPPDKAMGDFAFACFRLAKEQKKSPADLARELAHAFPKNTLDLQKVECLGPYVNFFLASGDAVHRVVRDVEQWKEEYGKAVTDTSQSMVFEYANPNTHKELHIGHFRNFILGTSLSRILKHGGVQITPVSYINDVGRDVAKTLWFLVVKNGFELEKLTEDQTRTLLEKIPADQHTANFLGKTYIEANKASEEQEAAKQQISYVQSQLEAHTPAWELLWRETRQWCVYEFQQIFDELGIEIQRQYFESEVIDQAGGIVDRLLKEGIAKESQGAIIVDLEDKKLEVMIVRKSDGNLLYASKDLPLALLKIKEYPQLTHCYILTDNRQNLYFKQLAAILGMMGVTQVFGNIGYGLVTLPEGAMSSRKGNVITYQWLHDTVIEEARKEIIDRHPDWSEGKVTHSAWAIGMAAMKFAVLRQDADKTLVFDIKEALAFEGATGPYCQYSIMRLSSVIRKAEKAGHTFVTNGPLSTDFPHASEKHLALQVANFPRLVELATRDKRPSVIAQWCFETAQAVNEFYRDVPILDGDAGLLPGRLRLANAARHVLTQGLDLLAIPLPDEM